MRWTRCIVTIEKNFHAFRPDMWPRGNESFANSLLTWSTSIWDQRPLHLYFFKFFSHFFQIPMECFCRFGWSQVFLGLNKFACISLIKFFNFVYIFNQIDWSPFMVTFCSQMLSQVFLSVFKVTSLWIFEKKHLLGGRSEQEQIWILAIFIHAIPADMISIRSMDIWSWNMIKEYVLNKLKVDVCSLLWNKQDEILMVIAIII